MTLLAIQEAKGVIPYSLLGTSKVTALWVGSICSVFKHSPSSRTVIFTSCMGGSKMFGAAILKLTTQVVSELSRQQTSTVHLGFTYQLSQQYVSVAQIAPFEWTFAEEQFFPQKIAGTLCEHLQPSGNWWIHGSMLNVVGHHI